MPQNPDYSLSRGLLAGLCIAFAGLPQAMATTLIPNFSAAVFDPDQDIDNRYFPLHPSYKATIKAAGIDGNGLPFTERSELSYGGPGRVILGIQTFAQRDLAFEGGQLVEDTFDYYAQDTDGNVWYMGEDVINYVYDDAGVLISTNDESAWIAGENGALPGWIMPADPVSDFAYFQEVAPADGALDEARIWATGLTVEAGGQLFDDVLVVFEVTSLDPEAREFKFYAPDVGLIRVEEGLDADLLNPEIVFEIVEVAPIPLPGGVLLLFGGLAALAALSTRAEMRRG